MKSFLIFLLIVFLWIAVGQTYGYWLGYSSYHPGSMAQKIIDPYGLFERSESAETAPTFEQNLEEDKVFYLVIMGMFGSIFAVIFTGLSWVVTVFVFFFGGGLLKLLHIIG
ncbi:hypothetical protein IID20_02865 [Patescibacteria group bacterium]|nr:hypothetical protein [Patescibacteria group bacterium]